MFYPQYFRQKRPGILRIVVLLLAVFLLLPSSALPQNKAAEIDSWVQAYFETGTFNGTVLVAEKGTVIFKKGYGSANREWNIPNQPDVKFRLGSITKQFTSMLIMQLVDAGKIVIQGKLTDYLPYYRQDTGGKVTIHHLLTHTSGIPSYTSIPDFFRDVSRDPYPVEKFITEYCSGDLEFEPGSQYKYNNSGYFILGAVIEEVTEKRYEDVLKEYILDPLGMKDTGYDHYETIISKRADGYDKTFDGYVNSPYLDMSLPYAAGSLFSTVEDLYIWDRALYTDKLLPSEKMKLLFEPHVKAGGGFYGYGWQVSERKLSGHEQSLKVIAHGGGINGFNTSIVRLVDEQHLVVLFNNTPGANLGAISLGIVNILYGLPNKPPKKSAADAVYSIIKEKGISEGIKQYRELREKHRDQYLLSVNELNRLGYYLMEQKKMLPEAIAVFKLNIELFPKNSNAYDSLGEAYLNAGEKELAIKNYEKSLELNPKNTNAAEKLKELKKSG